MIGLDCNILVQLAFAEHPANTKSQAIVKAEIESGTDLVLPSLVVTEFLYCDRRAQVLTSIYDA